MRESRRIRGPVALRASGRHPHGRVPCPRPPNKPAWGATRRGNKRRGPGGGAPGLAPVGARKGEPRPCFFHLCNLCNLWIPSPRSADRRSRPDRPAVQTPRTARRPGRPSTCRRCPRALRTASIGRFQISNLGFRTSSARSSVDPPGGAVVRAVVQRRDPRGVARLCQHAGAGGHGHELIGALRPSAQPPRIHRAAWARGHVARVAAEVSQVGTLDAAALVQPVRFRLRPWALRPDCGLLDLSGFGQ